MVFTLPETQWDSGALLQVSHSKAINLALSHVSDFDRTVSEKLEPEIRRIKAERELVSYRAPSDVDWNATAESQRAVEICVLLVGCLSV